MPEARVGISACCQQCCPLLRVPGSALVNSGGSNACNTCIPHFACPFCYLPVLQVLLNKIALSQFRFRSANALLLFQCGLAAALVQACAVLGIVKLEPFSLRVAKVW